MPLIAKFPIERRPKLATFSDLNQPADEQWVVWFYGGIRKNQSGAASLPLMTVCFRKLIDKELSDDYILQRVPITSLGIFRIGTIWRNNKSEITFSFPVKIIHEVDFDAGAWTTCSFYESANRNEAAPFDSTKYPLAYKNDRNHYLKLAFKGGGTLFIPCFEFLARCYGKSGEMKRIITGHGWEEAENLIFAPIDEPEEENKWKVRLRKRLYNSDAILAAHIKYDPYSKLRVREIHSQLQAAYNSSTYEASHFIKVGPWHQGKVTMGIRGIQLTNNSFLALNIFGCSDPIGEEILRDRENSRLVSKPASVENQGKAWKGVLKTTKSSLPEIVNIINHEEPDHSGDTVEIHDEGFITLGTPRAIVDVIRDQAKSSAAPKTEAKSDSYSGGQRYGDNKDVGHASEHAPVKLESHGVLRDMWNALLYLQQMYPSTFLAVEWFTFEKQYMSEGEPELIRLEPFTKKDNVKKSQRDWVYLSKNVTRGIMVLRVKTPIRTVHICEVERRFKIDGQEEQKNDEYRGIVFNIIPNETIESILKKIMKEVRLVKGIVYKMGKALPKSHAIFKHGKADKEPVSGYAAAIHALDKLGAIQKGHFKIE